MYSYDPQSIRLWLRSERRRYVEDSPLQMPSADALPFYFFLSAGALVGFVILWLLFLWSYIKVSSEFVGKGVFYSHLSFFFSR